MEGEKKGKKEKRAAKKASLLGTFTESLETDPKPKEKEKKAPAPRKTASSGTGIRSKKKPKEPTVEQIQLRAYFIAERRQSLGIHGDSTSDWVQAERELREEA
jgi:isopentenyldiphosphate isomerase